MPQRHVRACHPADVRNETSIVATVPIVTARLRLDPWTDAHAGFLVALSAMPEVTRYVGDGAPWPRERALDVAARQRAHWRDHGFGWRVMVTRDAHEPIGFIALSFAGEGAGVAADEYEIGWWLAPAHWRAGFTREAAAAVYDEAFARVGAPSVVARIQPVNTASIAVARGLGMTYEGDGHGRFAEPFAIYRGGPR